MWQLIMCAALAIVIFSSLCIVISKCVREILFYKRYQEAGCCRKGLSSRDCTSADVSTSLLTQENQCSIVATISQQVAYNGYHEESPPPYEQAVKMICETVEVPG